MAIACCHIFALAFCFRSQGQMSLSMKLLIILCFKGHHIFGQVHFLDLDYMGICNDNFVCKVLKVNVE